MRRTTLAIAFVLVLLLTLQLSTALEQNSPPVITGIGGPTTLKTGQSGTWSVNAYDPDGNYLSYSVDWGEAALVGVASGATQVIQQTTFQHQYQLPGTFTISITAYDSQGASTLATTTVTVRSDSTPLPSNTYWTQWYNRDDPSATGDWEHKQNFPDVCEKPIALECKTLSGVDYLDAGQDVICNTAEGLVCYNNLNNNQCKDYKVRFLCPINDVAPKTPREIPCVDNDGGVNENKRSTIKGLTAWSAMQQAEVQRDHCRLPDYANEFFCNDDGYVDQKSVFCKNGCENGICRPELITPAYCTDSDGGIFKDIKGTTKKVDRDGTSQSFTDECATELGSPLAKVKEYYCNADKSIGSQYLTCENGCRDGACLQVTQVCGNAICEAGEATSCPQDCRAYAKCTDSDRGVDFYLKGTARGKYGSNPNAFTEDYCTSGGLDGNGNPVNLVEFYCINEYEYNATSYYCPYGCSNGACVNPIKCTETDGGKNYYVKGEGSGLYGYSGDKGIMWGENRNKCGGARFDADMDRSLYYDCCFDSSYSNQLNEAYCDPQTGLLLAEGTNCPNGCRDGACITDTKPVCGNGICEAGEADDCPICNGPECPMRPCKAGTCPQDCQTETVVARLNEFVKLSNGMTADYSSERIRVKLTGIAYPKCAALSNGEQRNDRAVEAITEKNKKCGPIASFNVYESSGATVSEKVKCVFSGAMSSQRCYSDKGECTGKETCVVDVSGRRGEKVTWKSTCGGYAYTEMDGDNDYAEFKCAQEPRLTAAVNTNKPIYSTGDSILFRAKVRDQTNTDLDMKVKIYVVWPSGTIKETDMYLERTERDSYIYSYKSEPLSKEAEAGLWTAYVVASKGNFNAVSEKTYFKVVQEVEVPNMFSTVSTDKTYYALGEPVRFMADVYDYTKTDLEIKTTIHVVSPSGVLSSWDMEPYVSNTDALIAAKRYTYTVKDFNWDNELGTWTAYVTAVKGNVRSGSEKTYFKIMKESEVPIEMTIPEYPAEAFVEEIKPIAVAQIGKIKLPASGGSGGGSGGVVSITGNVVEENKPTTKRLLPAERAFDVDLRIGESKMFSGYTLTLKDIDGENAVIVLTKGLAPKDEYICAPGCREVADGCLCPKIRIYKTDKGYGIDIDSGKILAKEIKISPGAENVVAVLENLEEQAITVENLVEGVEMIAYGNKKVKITTNKEKLETYLNDDTGSAKTRLIIKGDDKGLTGETGAGDKEIKILPSEASDTAQLALTAEYQDVELKDSGKQLVYEFVGNKRIRVLGIIPVESKVSTTIDAESGEVVEVNKPWYAAISTW